MCQRWRFLTLENVLFEPLPRTAGYVSDCGLRATRQHQHGARAAGAFKRNSAASAPQPARILVKRTSGTETCSQSTHHDAPGPALRRVSTDDQVPHRGALTLWQKLAAQAHQTRAAFTRTARFSMLPSCGSEPGQTLAIHRRQSRELRGARHARRAARAQRRSGALSVRNQYFCI